MLKAFKYRIYPTKEQVILLAKHFGCVRWVYNYALAKKQKAYGEDGINLSRYDIQAELPLLKKQDETQWLSQVNSSPLQVSLLNLDRAYKVFFKNKKGFPNFKSNHKGSQSFQSPATNYFTNSGLLSIPKFREGIKIELHRNFEGKIKTTTISRTVTGKYFASLLVETPDKIIKPKKPNKKKAVGIDLGIKTFAVLSTGEEIANPKHLKNSLKRLKRLQRNLSRKVKGSNRTPDMS